MRKALHLQKHTIRVTFEDSFTQKIEKIPKTAFEKALFFDIFITLSKGHTSAEKRFPRKITTYLKTTIGNFMPTPLNVLMIEDDLLDAELTITQLERDGFVCAWQRVQTAHDLRSALEKDRFDLILIDYNMPGFDGLTALKIINEFELAVPSIFVTGNLQPELAIDSIKAGAIDFVHKDRLTRLGSSVRRALDEFALRRENHIRENELRILRELNDAANQGTSLNELAAILRKILPAVLEADYTEIYLRSLEEHALILYQQRSGNKIFDAIEKMLDFKIPHLSVPLDDNNFYANCLHEKKVMVYETPAEMEAFYELYLKVANLPESLDKRIRAKMSAITELLGIKKVVLFPLIAGDQILGLLGLSYRDKSRGQRDIQQLAGMLGQIAAIFARRRLEEEFIRLSHQQKMILDSAAEGIIGLDMEGKHIFVNPVAAKMLGYTIDELQGKNNHTLYHLAHTASRLLDPRSCVLYTSTEDDSGSTQREYETVFTRKGGVNFPVSFTSSKIVENGKKVGIVVSFRDMTEQLENTRALARLGQVVEQAQVSVGITDIEGKLIYVNPFFEKVSGYAQNQLMGENPRILKSGHQDQMFYKTLWSTISAGNTWQGQLINKKNNGDLYYEDAIIFPVKTERDEIINYATVKREITAEVEAQRELERQFSRLEILHRIDATILSSMDLNLTLDVVLSEALRELDVDAIDILLFNLVEQTFSCVSRLGFRTDALEHTHLRMGEGLAGQAAITKEMVSVTDMGELMAQASQLKDEEFLSYYGIPLIARGDVKGVLEIFLRKEFEPDDGWRNFLNTIARQTAIAIENTQLFEGLHSKNAELHIAYEATLEGWVRGLEMHDMETEGHSRRVVEMTLQLARHLGYPKEEMEHLRRGALLHDIGKLGIPKSVLNKKGPLTPAERILIEQHTIYAYEMLADIPYLQPALDIPYSHHERWDGSGYPLGLKGDEIPFAARIFAIIDVYDALIYNRPYRKAWDREKVLAHLQERSGSHFDPVVVDAFFDEFVLKKDSV